MADIKTWKSGINFGGHEIVGDRSGQEDYSLFRLLKNGSELLIVLADGMGGHTSGEVASKNTVTVFDATFNSYPSESVPTKLGAALQQANSDLSRLITENQSLDGMGCTLVGTHIGSEGLRWISVGDSLLYLYRDGALTHLNADHSMAPIIEESYRSGKISKEEALNHPNKNALRSAVMGSEIPLIDSPELPLAIYQGDILIVASDGLLTLSADQITNTLGKYKNQTANEIALALVNGVVSKKRPRQDNTTVQVMIVPSSFGRQNKFFKKFLLISIVSLIAIVFAGTAYYLDAPGLINKFINPQSDAASIPVPIPVPIPVQEAPALNQVNPLSKPESDERFVPGIGSSKETKKSNNDGKKSKSDSGKQPPKSSKGSADFSSKNDEGIPKSLPNNSTAPSNAGLEGAVTGEGKGTSTKPKPDQDEPAKPTSDPKNPPPAKSPAKADIVS
jgi:PPM family protein phosphatase